FCTGVYSVDPRDRSRRLGGHKMTATTEPERWLAEGNGSA
ncbi:MAG: hypothetical protein V7636_1129, partial [Actinomycetota bacterium]